MPVKEVPITQGKVALVDDEDYERVMQFKWYAAKRRRRYYAVRNLPRVGRKQSSEFLHNFILGIKGVDHRDGDGLNDRRENLRAATQQQNLQGRCRKPLRATSRYRGVSWDTKRQKWRSNIWFDQKHVSLGRFAVEVEAARAYDTKARELFGEFASPNFPE